MTAVPSYICPGCGFIGSEHYMPYSARWHRDHRAAHLAAFPDCDPGTVANLDYMLRDAEQREQAVFVGPDDDEAES